MASPAEVRAAGGVYVVDDVEVGAPGSCKVESWASWADNIDKDFIGTVSPACVAHIGRPVELGAAYNRFRSGAVWGTTADVKAKTNLVPVEVGKVGLALSGAVSWDLINSQHSASTINVPVTWQLSEPLKININAGWLHDSITDLHWCTYAPASSGISSSRSP